MNSNSLPCVGLILEDDVSLALKDVLLQAGYQVAIESITRFAASRATSAPVDAWIFDARKEKLLESLMDSDRFLLPADNPPSPVEARRFAQWSAGLLNQLDSGIGRKAVSRDDKHISPGWEQVQAVWLLVGSAGAPTYYLQARGGLIQTHRD